MGRGKPGREMPHGEGAPAEPIMRTHDGLVSAAACLLLLSIGFTALGEEPNVASLLAAGTAAIFYGVVAQLVTGVATDSVGAGVYLVFVATVHAALDAEPISARLTMAGLGGLVYALAV